MGNNEQLDYLKTFSSKEMLDEYYEHAGNLRESACLVQQKSDLLQRKPYVLGWVMKRIAFMEALHKVLTSKEPAEKHLQVMKQFLQHPDDGLLNIYRQIDEHREFVMAIIREAPDIMEKTPLDLWCVRLDNYLNKLRTCFDTASPFGMAPLEYPYLGKFPRPYPTHSLAIQKIEVCTDVS